MRLYVRPFKQSIEKHGHMADVVYPDAEALFAGE